MRFRKTTTLIASIIFFGMLCSGDHFPQLKGHYLGQKPPGMTPELFAPGIISTDARELNAVFSPRGDEFYFAIYHPDPDETCVIMRTKQVDGIWTEPAAVPFSGTTADVDMAFSLDGKTLYFCSTRTQPPGASSAPKHDIWFCDRLVSGDWSEPKNVGRVINTSESETYPCWTRNGRMYFSAIREGGFGGKDIYYSQQAEGTFSAPINIGSAVNTPYDEGDTYVAPDEEFLIVSVRGRPDCAGGSDLYISFRKNDGEWASPVNMGVAINTEAYEYSPMVTPDGRFLFFSRFEESGSDIYWVDAGIIDSFRPETR
ncbi:MAG: hypothetical protein GY906_07255 [bacterium]|nr:hypothetical protein [bacterium]